MGLARWYSTGFGMTYDESHIRLKVRGYEQKDEKLIADKRRRQPERAEMLL